MLYSPQSLYTRLPPYVLSSHNVNAFDVLLSRVLNHARRWGVSSVSIEVQLQRFFDKGEERALFSVVALSGRYSFVEYSCVPSLSGLDGYSVVTHPAFQGCQLRQLLGGSFVYEEVAVSFFAKPPYVYRKEKGYV